MVHSHGNGTTSPLVLEDTSTTVGEEGPVFSAFGTKLPKAQVQLKTQTVMDKAFLTTFLFPTVDANSCLRAAELLEMKCEESAYGI